MTAMIAAPPIGETPRWVMRDWLNGFDARITLTPTPFLIAGLLALIIAIITFGRHAIRIARSSPIHALRYE